MINYDDNCGSCKSFNVCYTKTKGMELERICIDYEKSDENLKGEK